MTCIVKYFFVEENQEKEITQEFKPNIVVLRADNTTDVDSRNGAFSDEETPQEFIMGEYDFIRSQKLYSIEQFEQLAILRADQLNRFD